MDAASLANALAIAAVVCAMPLLVLAIACGYCRDVERKNSRKRD